MKKKILFVLPAFTFGGTVFSTLNMIMLLPKDEFDIEIFAMAHQGPVKKYYSNFKILPENIWVASLLGRIDKEKSIGRKIVFILVKIICKLLKAIGIDYPMIAFRIASKSIQRKNKYDIVASCQEGDSTYCVSCFKNVKKIAWFRTEYGVYKNQLSKNVLKKEQRIYRTFDNIVCVSQTTRDDFCEYFKNISEKVIAIHNIQNVENIVSKSAQRVDDSFDKCDFNIVSVGRIAPQKRFASIPKIASTLKRNSISFKWYIIGDGNVQGEWDKLQSALDEYDVRDVVTCMGSRLNPYPYIKNADLIVVPSYYEACPRVIAESKILHTPVVAADFSSACEFVENDVDGYVDKLDNLSKHVASLILDKDLYDRIKSACNNYEMDNDAIYVKLRSVLC